MRQSQMKMSPARIIVVWIVATLLSAALLFPPFGYTRYFVISAQHGELRNPLSVPWTYLQHGFIFAKPPFDDPAVEANFNKFQGEVALQFNVGIGWRFVGIECAVILLLGSAAFLTLGRKSY